jgi:uncharacterized damage-inducible protein DinB
MKKTLFISCLLIMGTVFSPAQAQDYSKLKEQLVKDWQRAKEYTREFLTAMPADKYSWQPSKEIRSFAKQMLHLTYLNIGFVSNGTGQPRDFLGINLATPIEEILSSRKDSVIYYTMAGYDFAISGLKNMDASKLMEMNKNETRLAWILKAYEHQVHHRGQCVMYLRQLGIVPPHERLF